MINIFYHPDYIKTKKVFLTKQFKYSVFNNLLIDFSYFLNIPIHNNLITSGPQKRFNNLIKTFKGDPDFVFNRIKSNNSYIVQFDIFGEKILKKLLSNNQQHKKILIGPLYNIEYLKKLIQIVNEYENIKILTASKTALNNLVNEMNFDIDENKVSTFPSGVVSEKNLSNKEYKQSYRKNECIVYFKKREESELNALLNYLKSKNLNFKVFKYGNYKNNDLLKAARNAKFGIILGTTESQGFAIQEIMSENLPLVIFDKNFNTYEGFKISGSTVPYWNEYCGIKVNDLDEFKKMYTTFMEQFDEFKPVNLIRDELTYEVFSQNLKKEFGIST